MTGHAAVAVLELEEGVVQQVLDDFETAPIDDRLKTTLAFLKKLCLTPDELSGDDRLTDLLDQ